MSSSPDYISAFGYLRSANTYGRVRGYQYRSEGPGEAKRNPSAFSKMLQSRKEQNTDTPIPDANTDADAMASKGFAEPVSKG